MDAVQDAAEKRLERIGRAHLQATRDLTAQIEKIIGRYAQRFQLTREEAEARLKQPFDEDSRAYGYRMSRAEAMRKAAQEQAQKLEELTRREMDAQWVYTARESARRAESLLDGMGFSTPDTGGFQQALDTRWAGQSYSESIWRNTQSLAETLEREVTAAFLSGKSNAAIGQAIMNRFSVSFRQAERLVRTETSYVCNQAAIDRYKDAGFKHFEFLTAKDSRTCKVCAGHDGWVHALRDAKPGENMPPLHPNCRCTVLPVVPETAYNERKTPLQEDAQRDTIKAQGSDEMNIRMPINSPIEQRNTGKGNPNAILISGRPLNNRQQRLLERLPDYDARITVPKGDISMRDLSALTAETGCEYAMFTKGNERLIVRGNERMTNIGPEEAREMAGVGWRWSGHTHPGTDDLCLFASDGDLRVLEAFMQKQSVIYNSKCAFLKFWR